MPSDALVLVLSVVLGAAGVALVVWAVVWSVRQSRIRRWALATVGEMREKVASGAPPAEVLTLGRSLADGGRPVEAAEAFRYVVDNGDPDQVSQAEAERAVLP